MAAETIVKRWGNSLGIILPKNLVEERGLKENEKILVEVVKEADFRNVFGSLKTKMSGQAFKNLARKGWET